MKHSTHLVDFGPGRGFYPAIVCGNYFRFLKPILFGGGNYLTKWMRMPSYVSILCPAIEPMVETEGSGVLNTSDNLK